MFKQLRNAIFGERRQPVPASIVVDPTQLVLTCEDTSATISTKVEGKNISHPFTEWTGDIECRIFDGPLGFQLFAESNTPSERKLDLVRRIVTYEHSLKSDALNAVFKFFDGLRRDHGVDFSGVIDHWSHDAVARLVHSPCCLIDDTEENPESHSRFIVSFSTQLDEEHGIDVLVNHWQIVDCGCLV